MVDRGRAILLQLCERIEAERPSDLEALYALTQAVAEEFNLLDREFMAAGSGSETVAREWICDEFSFVASAYGIRVRGRRYGEAGRRPKLVTPSQAGHGIGPARRSADLSSPRVRGSAAPGPPTEGRRAVLPALVGVSRRSPYAAMAPHRPPRAR